MASLRLERESILAGALQASADGVIAQLHDLRRAVDVLLLENQSLREELAELRKLKAR